MKKALSLILTLVMLLSLMSAMIPAASAASNGDLTVVYLGGSKKGDGKTPDTPTNSLSSAYTLLDRTQDCTIVVCDTYNQTGGWFPSTEFDGSITITSVYDGVDYRKTGATYQCVGARFVCTGEYIFKDININITGDYMFVIANHHPFTLDTGVDINYESSKSTGLGFGNAFSILGGYQKGTPQINSSKQAPPAETDADTNITVLSGEKLCIGAYSRQIDGAYYMGTANITIGGDAQVSRLYLTPCNNPFSSGKTMVTVKDNAVVDEIYGATASGFADEFVINWQDGDIKFYKDNLYEKLDLLFTKGKTLIASDKVTKNANYEKVAANFDTVTVEGGESNEEPEKKTVEVKLVIDSLTGYVNGVAVPLDAAPVIRQNRTLLPIRFVAENLGATVGWDPALGAAVITGEGVEIKFVLKNGTASSALVNGVDTPFDSPAFVENGRTYMPVRFIADLLGATVDWDAGSRTAILTKEVSADAVNTPSTEISAINLHTIGYLNTEKPSADSHEGFSSHSSVELNFRQYAELEPSVLNTHGATYPRVKVMKDGRYIMFYQNDHIGTNIYYTTSSDAINFEKGQVLFKTRAAEGFEGEADSIRFSTCDAVVLENGDILAICSYRLNHGYSKDAAMGGLIMKRSTDNGKTFGEEQIIYTGINWEPYVGQAPDGTVQVFFTHNAPKFYYDGKVAKEYLSSGVGMIYSKDNGVTWVPDSSEAPYAAYVVMQQRRDVDLPKTQYTDQMPSVAYLNNGKSVMATESRPTDGDLQISLGYSSNYWSDYLDMEEEGPAERTSNIFVGAAPYIMQFDSGETLLTYNTVSLRYALCIGDENGANFGTAYLPFKRTGYWGTLEKRSSHSAIGSIAHVSDDESNRIMIGTFYLNHAVNAENTQITVDGDNKEWTKTEALFVGSESQAQIAVRTAVANDKLYLLIERADYYLSDNDATTICLSEEGMDGFYRIKVGKNGVAEFIKYGSKLERCDVSTLACASKFEGTYENHEDTDAGVVTEISIPLSLFKTKQLSINLSVNNRDADGNTVSDTFSGTSMSTTDNWPLIFIK